ncbi:MAG: putative dual-specificity RNA methyltransferase RlmN [bacterium]|nr:MAG: putative dual-specificity RNA methyltransferase RlmN [bacterium]
MKLTTNAKQPKQASIHSFTQEDLSHTLMEAGFEKYRSQQIFQFLYQKKLKQFSDMKNLPESLRTFLTDHFTISSLSNVNHLTSQDKSTHKHLFSLSDGLRIESVVIKEGSRNTLCLSSQIGCSLNCRFCATGQMEIKRNLNPGEIIDQFLFLKDKYGSVDNIVFMGMGEPLLNYNNVMKSIRILNSKDGLGVGIKRITISTAGIAKGIRRLAGESMNIQLAVSLNAPDQELREEIMPFSRKINLQEMIAACHFYQEKTGKRITFEYVLIKDINMRKNDAKKIIKLSKELHFNLNLIPYNPISDCDYQSPTPYEVDQFVKSFQYSR